MFYKCKFCGGDTTLDPKNGITICDFCGTKQTLPLFTDDSERMLYERGNNYLSHSEYDKAENVFNQLLTIKPNSAELYWDLVLCKYGVTYVKDPKTGKYIPTCNRTHYTPIFSDENYKKAIELSSGEKKALFEDDAKTIDNIQKGIIAVSKKEKPFDIFISYKETDANGNRTKDSVEAQKLYEKLTEAGYKVFFSRITLEDKVGTEYEPYIYAALYSSKVMLTICSSKENIEAVWVKNEWSRFLGFRQNDNSKTVLPLYFDMEKADLPDEFALLSAYDMSADGFTDELLRGIKKLIPLPIMKAKRRKQIRKTIGITAAIFCIVAITVTAIFLPGYLEDKKFAENYAQATTLFENADYEGAAKIFTELGNYKDSVEMVKKCAIQPKYDAAMQLYYDGNYAEATWAFDALGDYGDSAEQKEKMELKWRKSLAIVDVLNYWSYGRCSYSVTANGLVEKSNDFGSFDAGIPINDHGKAISIGFDYDDCCVLYEDGVLRHVKYDNNESTAVFTENVVQVVSGVDTFALKNDGTVFSINGETDNMCSRPISEWKNIVELSYAVDENDLMGMADGGIYCLIGIKSDGTLEWAIQDVENTDTTKKIGKYISSLKNIKHVSAYIVADGGAIETLSIAACDYDNTVFVMSKSYFEDASSYQKTYKNVDVLDLGYSFWSSDLCVIDSKRRLRILGSESIIEENAIRVVANGVITQNDDLIYDEWLERK